ncbi:TetR/AcrR family transcriptional regulator [Levilactobacillus brevis]|nr:TetR/AcrR family transcriptional regulator [Levilactobacillus brevis]
MGTRRRGDELESAIYQVTYQLLTTNNGTALTFSQVAKAAHTSRTVLYRYWESPFDLVLATLTHYRRKIHSRCNWNILIRAVYEQI